MPDIDPAALSRLDTGNTTPQLSSRTLPSLNTQQKRPAQTAPRVDIEPIYTALKNAIPENWTAYKDAISNFILGFLTLNELSRAIDHFISIDTARVHLHNQLLCGIYTNIAREAPEQAVASWVSANDKPSSLAKPLSGDAAEQRLKYEVMQLPPRVRLRLKGIQDEPYSPITHSLLLAKDAKWINNPTAPSSHLSAGGSASVSASGANTSTNNSSSAAGATSSSSAAAGLNKELEIRKKYNITLSTETRDVPGFSSLTDRLIPTCYEEGLSSGPEAPEVMTELLSTAMESFIKETIFSIVGRSRANGPLSGPEGGAVSSLYSAPPPSHPPSNGVVINILDPNSTAVSSFNGEVSVGAISNPPASQPPPPSRAAAAAAAAAAGLGASSIATLGIMTASYKKKVEKEEVAAAKGDVKRSDMGLLPIEVASLREPRMGRNMRGDVGLAWELGDAWIGGMMPWLGEKVVLNEFAEFEAAKGFYGVTPAPGTGSTRVGFNGVTGGARDGVFSSVAGRSLIDAHILDPEEDPMHIDSEETQWSWTGAQLDDRKVLGLLLDDCLSIGQ